jgi:hypothetical protein
MALETITSALITQFSDMIHIRAQQSRARLRPYVDIRRMTGDVYAYDGLGTVEARELTGRLNLTVFDDIEFNRREITRRRFVVTLPIDKMDTEGMLIDPQGRFAEASVKALERVFDLVCYQAMFATVNTGQTFQTPITAANDGVSTVDATTGLTLAKILQIKQNYIDGEVGNDMPVDICIGISGEEHTTLLQIDQFISTRYTTQLQLEKGVARSVADMDLIKFGNNVTNPVLAVSSGTRACFAMASNGICVGMSREWDISIKDRPDYVDTKQVQIVGVLGAVRTEGKLIQQLNTTV